IRSIFRGWMGTGARASWLPSTLLYLEVSCRAFCVLGRRAAAGRAALGWPVLVQLVGEVDDPQARPALEEGAQTQDITVVQDPLPPVSGHEGRRDARYAMTFL